MPDTIAPGEITQVFVSRMYSASGEKTKWVYTSGLTALSSCGDSTDTFEAPQVKYTAVSLKGCSLGTATVTLKSTDGQRTYGSAPVTVTLPAVGTPKISVAISGTVANLTWTEPDGAGKYHVSYTTPGSDVVEAWPIVRKHRAIGLTRNKTYLFKVRAQGDGETRSTEWGDWSEIKQAYSGPIGAPYDIKAIDWSTTSVDVQFKILDGAKQYQVRYKRADETSGWRVTTPKTDLVAGSGITRAATVPGLEPNKSYVVGIQLFGDGSRYTTEAGAWGTHVVLTYKGTSVANKIAAGSCHTGSAYWRYTALPDESDPVTRRASDNSTHYGSAELQGGKGTNRLGKKPMVVYFDYYCADATFETTSFPGAKSISLLGEVKGGTLSLPSTFTVEDDLDGKNYISDLRALYTEPNPPTRTTGSAVRSTGTHTCTHCAGLIRHTGYEHAIDIHYFRHLTRHAFGTHTHTIENGWTTTNYTKTSQIAAYDSLPASRLELMEEFSQDLGAREARRLTDWVLDR